MKILGLVLIVLGAALCCTLVLAGPGVLLLVVGAVSYIGGAISTRQRIPQKR